MVASNTAFAANGEGADCSSQNRPQRSINAIDRDKFCPEISGDILNETMPVGTHKTACWLNPRRVPLAEVTSDYRGWYAGIPPPPPPSCPSSLLPFYTLCRRLASKSVNCRGFCGEPNLQPRLQRQISGGRWPHRSQVPKILY
eukprot:m.343583 g.343583  ORF g.343583 m.343583 type:complete len:143 (+) comp16550_c0_seq75:2955-3383(+)